MNTEIKIGAEGAVEKAMKYFVNGGKNIETLCSSMHFSLVYIVDPYVGPHFAAGFLQACKANEWIDGLDDGCFLDVETGDWSKWL